MVFNATFNNILVKIVAVSFIDGENHRPATSHWQTLSHNVVSSTPCLSGFELTTLVVIGTDCIDSYKSNYHTIMTMTAPQDYDIVLGNKEKLYLINMFLTIIINNRWKKHLDIQLPYDHPS
jgi:hypothetical protein